MKKTALWISIIVIVALGGVIWFSRSDVSAPVPEASPVENGEMPVPEAGVGAPPAQEMQAVKEFTVTGKNFSLPRRP